MRLTTASIAVLLFVIGAVLATKPAYSQLSGYTVAELLKPCMEGDAYSRWGAAAEAECEQYINGFTDALQMTKSDDDDDICLPASNRATEVRWAFMKWAHQHYEERNMPAAEGLMQTIKESFPCE